MKKWIFLTVFGAMFSSNLVYSDDWQSHWFNGANALRNNDFNKAIEEYTLAINSVDSSKHPYLYIGRASAYFKAGYLKPENYKKAIQDLSILINNKDASDIDKLNARWLRGQIYLISGMKEEFKEDSKELEKLDLYFTQLEENENYAGFKLGELMRSNENAKKAFVNLLYANQMIDSENDVIFTPFQMGIVKKSSSKSIAEIFSN